MRYRINYGNGQIEAPATRQQARADLAHYRRSNPNAGDFAFLEFEDPDTGDWFACR
jgi:hypothetical protein